MNDLSQLINGLYNDEISLDYFCQQLAMPDILSQLDLPFILQLGAACRDNADNGDWQRSCTLLEHTAATVFKHINDIDVVISYVAVADFIYVVTEALKDVPDPDLLISAEADGKFALTLAMRDHDDHWSGILAQRLGALFQLPYTAKRDPTNYAVVINRWLNKQAANRFNNTNRAPMPQPLDAIKTAQSYFEQAMAFASEYGKGFVEKSLAECLIWRRRLGESISEERVATLLHQAEELLGDKSADWQIEIRAMQHELGIKSSAPPHQPATTFIPENHTKEQLAAELADIRALCVHEPTLAFDRLETLWKLLPIEKDRYELADLYSQALVTVLRVTGTLPSVPKLGSKPKAFRKATRPLLDEQASNITCQQRFQRLAGLAVVSNAFDAENVGIDIASKACALAEDSPEKIGFLRVIICRLKIDYGASAWFNKNYLLAANRYLASAGECTANHLHELSRIALGRAIEAVSAANYPADTGILLQLASVTPAIEGNDSSGNVALRMRHLWNQYLAHLFSRQTVDAEALSLAIQSAKSGIFSTLVSDPVKWRWRDSPLLAKLFDRHVKLSAKPTTHDNWTDFDNQYLLAALDDRVRTAGADDYQKLLNVEGNIDSAIRADMSTRVLRSDDYPIVPLSNLLALLDENSVLLNSYIGRTTDGQYAVWTCLLSGSECAVGIYHGGAMPSAYLGVEVGGGLMDDTGLFIASLREELLVDAGEIKCREDGAADQLSMLYMQFIKPLERKLSELKAQGKDHLVICPHGSGHFLPWHLLESEDKKPLAQDWTVSYLPSLSLLKRRSPPIESVTKYVAFGMSFTDVNPYHAPPLPQVQLELKEIKRITGAETFVDAEATESRFFHAICNAQALHISTHGKIQAAAPAFHKLYLHPDSDSDGIIHAYELLEHDLSAIKVVTLSACETALGRVDLGDNLRGIPASLFLAGVRTIIGTLWEVDSDVSTFFFVSFYQAIENGMAPLIAFTVAQKATREYFPAYCHWGAFQYAGNWF